jgi:hypothetical protein
MVNKIRLYEEILEELEKSFRFELPTKIEKYEKYIYASGQKSIVEFLKMRLEQLKRNQ